MNNRRNSIISKQQFKNGIRVASVVNINGRFPVHGTHTNCAKNTILYVMKGSGMISHSDQRSGLSAGSVMHLDNCETYYLKGQFSVYVMHV